ncbi:hypothetical protein [Salinirubrum litoreum]|uniref:Uncharacterized protein n=1 Tax=Salinirubrum litoreum TaxID=1126234 RepID=A0ABD5RB51_9EURY|nr:hypothetical protein [Salinirubrum litoreum]
MSRTLDPQWTSQSETMRVLDPLGAESTESTLQSRMFHPILSMAVTQRLRYLSFWCWVTANLDGDAPTDRALYEKVVLLGSDPHACPEEGTSTNGTLNPPDELSEALADDSIDEVPIDAETVSIGSEDTARFDSYYSGVFYNLLLLENDQTVTPLGQALADAYDAAVTFEFESVQAAVEAETLSRSLIERVCNSGCFCQISSQEREILRNAYWYLVSPTVEYDSLQFDQESGPEQLHLREFLLTDSKQLETASIEAELLGVSAADVEMGSENLEQFFEEGRHQFVRSSLTLLLATGDWADRRPTASPSFEHLTDAREVWRFLIHAEYASYGIQALFLAVQGVIRELEPIFPSDVLSSLFDHDEFDSVAGRALEGINLAIDPGADRSTLNDVRDAVYFGEAPTGNFESTLPDGPSLTDMSWADVTSRLVAADTETSEESCFSLTGHSERAYKHQLQSVLADASTVAEYRKVAALAAVLLARVSTRYEEYFVTDPLEPFLAWFKTAHDHPGPQTCWDVANDCEMLPSLATNRADWEGSPFAYTTAAFAKRWTLTEYFERLFEKIGDSNGRSPQLLHLNTDGTLTFDYQVNDGDLYNRGLPNAPTIKWHRIGDIGYELDLLETNRLDSLSLTESGRAFIGSFMEASR